MTVELLMRLQLGDAAFRFETAPPDRHASAVWAPYSSVHASSFSTPWRWQKSPNVSPSSRDCLK